MLACFRRVLTVLALVAVAILPANAAPLVPIDYTPAALKAAQASNQPFVLDFFATWCSTCKAQERAIAALAKANPAYANIKLIRVDWDENARGDLVRELSIPRRSTLVVMRGTKELGRIVAETGKDKIARLLDLAL